MDCPHCGKAFHDSWEQCDINAGEVATCELSGGAQKIIIWRAKITSCPSCKNHTIKLEKYVRSKRGIEIRCFSRNVYPQDTARKPTPKEVPADIKEDYEEACKALSISQKASAALSRRCLQAILFSQGYTQKDLNSQIKALLNETDTNKVITFSLRSTIDAIRNFGNFSAHPIRDLETLQIIPVEAGEAEWCLEILEEAFEHYYVRPRKAADRKAALNAKLSAAGKPPLQ